MRDLLSRVANLPNRSLIYYLHVFEDGDGRVHVPAEVLTRISAAANAPVYSHVNSYVGRGIVGGRAYSFEREGERAAELGLRIFAGEKPEQIGIQRVSDNDYVFDWRQLKRWGIPPSSLPQGSVVRFQEPTAWDLYKWHILGTALLVLLQSALITGFVVQRLRRGRAERRFQQAVNAAPTGMVMIDSQGRIVVANKQMEKLFGYSQVEMIGQPVDMLAPARYRDERADDRRAYFAPPEARTAGAVPCRNWIESAGERSWAFCVGLRGRRQRTTTCRERTVGKPE
jgi:PAS domain-containing protein